MTRDSSPEPAKSDAAAGMVNRSHAGMNEESGRPPAYAGSG